MAAGDVNGDGHADIITGAGRGGGPQLKVFDGVSGGLLFNFLAYNANFTGGVNVGAGDVNGDGRVDIITGPGVGGSPEVRVFSGKDTLLLRDFFANDLGFFGGVRVASMDLTPDGHADIIAGAGPGSGPRVEVFDGATGGVVRNFLAFDPGFMGGKYVG